MTHTLAIAQRPAPRKIARAIPREVAMNKLEAAYAQTLELLKRAGEIQAWWYEPVKLRLAGKTFFTPDFMVVNKAGEIWFHETKGFMRDDAAVKIKVAAEMYPFGFTVVRKKGNTWSYDEV